MRTATSLLIPVAAGAALAGCGNSRTAAPDVTRPLDPNGSTARDYPAQGIAFRSATTWTFANGQPPLVATMTSGRAVVTIWRYPRSQPLPRTQGQLVAARRALLGAARARDGSFQPSSAAVTRLEGQPTIAVVARETVGGQPRTVRSTHVFAYGAEYVIDELAPATTFPRTDRALFVPLLRSLSFSAPRP